ncbi:hypothetical protein LCGC14_1448280 [marine sediment metagenome]|uniref:Uncharacterized protein n=1 Tax=marine sediment metagenome TaxID=412755 RepID=A0A0F9K4V3_9ZZZZ
MGMTSTLQIWFPTCQSCAKITSFAGPKNLPADKLVCQKCGVVCEDANALIARNQLTVTVPEEAIREYFATTHTEIVRHKKLMDQG